MKKTQASKTARTRRDRPQHDPYAKLVKVIDARPGSLRLDEALTRLAERLRDANEEGAFQVSVAAEGELRPGVINVGRKESTFARGAVESPRFELIIEEGALGEVLSGARSPILVMARGQMRVRGDLGFGKRVYRRLAADDGIIDPCERGGAAP